MQVIKINGRPPKTYQIIETGIFISTFANTRLPSEEQIPFEEIKNEQLYYIQKSPMFLIVGGVFILLYAFSLVDSIKGTAHYPPLDHLLALPGLILIASYFIVQPKVFFLKTFTGKFIRFRVHKNEAEIASFVKNVIEKRNEFLKLKYGSPNLHLLYDGQYSNFSIMLKEKIFTTQEYQEKIKELNDLFHQTSPQKIYPGYSQN